MAARCAGRERAGDLAWPGRFVQCRRHRFAGVASARPVATEDTAGQRCSRRGGSPSLKELCHDTDRRRSDATDG